MDKQKIKDSIDSIIGNLITLKEQLDTVPVAKTEIIQAQAVKTDFDLLKDALENNWPEAINKNLICDPENETDKIERSRGIIELMVEERMHNNKFLDFGCGEGQTVCYAAEEQAKIAVGYDIKQHNWVFPKQDNLLLTNSFDKVVEKGPYDVVLLFDVLDHLEEETPLEILKKAKSVLTPTGKIYMRTHPKVSRHAIHAYHSLNKAYIHLVFSESELSQLIPDNKYVIKNNGPIFPLKYYSDLIAESGLKVLSQREIKESVESFFKTPLIEKRIIENTTKTTFPEFQMSLQFIDYILTHV